VDSRNRYLASGGSDSLIGLWRMSDLMLIKSFGYNDAKVMALSLNQDGSLIAAICEDENKKYLIEVYDFDFNHPYSASCGTLYSQTTSYEK
jgi:hypothetical protein